jgi:hypothetical protein
MTEQEVKVKDSGYFRLEDQISWYDKKSVAAQRNYKIIKIIEVVSAASISFFANHYPSVAATLGATIVVLEAVQQLNQWHSNWVSYRSTCESLRHEKYCYIEKAGPYANADPGQARLILVERIESLISTEHSKWIKSINSCKADTNIDNKGNR